MSGSETTVYLFRHPAWTRIQSGAVYEKAREIILKELSLPRVEVTFFRHHSCYCLPTYGLAEHFGERISPALVEGDEAVLLGCPSRALPLMSWDEMRALPPLRWLAEHDHFYDINRLVLHNNTDTCGFLVVGVNQPGLTSFLKLKWDR